MSEKRKPDFAHADRPKKQSKKDTPEYYIFKVTAYVRKGGWKSDYDTYSEFVVCCRTEDDAKMTHPNGCRKLNNNRMFSEWPNINQMDQLEVEKIGTASIVFLESFDHFIKNLDGSIFSRVVCSSYHAG